MFEFLEKHKKYAVYFPLVAYWLVLLFLTSLPGADVPDVHINDKMEHFSAFFGLGVLLNLMYYFQNRLPLFKRHCNLATLVTGSLYAALDELHQIYIPGRSCDINDWIADTIGILLALSFMYIFHKVAKVTK